MGYEATIGVETHVELTTRSKMFCGCPNHFGAEPNTAICPVCLGLPGALPVPNERAIELTVSLGLALEAEIAPRSLFHRKNYFYADLPKNYQISQFDLPLCRGGHLDLETEQGPARVGITRVHLEEDTGKEHPPGRVGPHPGRRGRAARLQPLRGAAHGGGERAGHPQPGGGAGLRRRAAGHHPGARPLRRPARGRADALRRQRLGPPRRERGPWHQGGGQEHELAALLAAGPRLRDRAAVGVARRRRRGGAGDPPLDEAAGCTRAGRSKEESSDYRYFPSPTWSPSPSTRAASSGCGRLFRSCRPSGGPVTGPWASTPTPPASSSRGRATAGCWKRRWAPAATPGPRPTGWWAR